MGRCSLRSGLGAQLNAPFDPNEIYTLTFDCYGTLIDWQRGVREAAAAIESLRNADLPRLVRDRERIEREVQRGPYQPYGAVLAQSLIAAAREQALVVAEEDALRFARTQASWPSFEESHAVLTRLAERWQLAILSNVETRVLAASVDLLDAPFEALVTAEELRSYKPSRPHFDAALARLGVENRRILHVAASLYHDVRPASALGFRTAWIDRENEGRAEDVAPDLSVPDLTALAQVLGC